MTEKETAMALLQVVGLTLPALAIYLQFLTSHINLSAMDDGEAANYHATRLSMVYLLISGILLILEIVLTPTWGHLLIGGSLTALGLALVTFILPILFSAAGLSDSRSILWPYQNLAHRLSGTTQKED